MLGKRSTSPAPQSAERDLLQAVKGCLPALGTPAGLGPASSGSAWREGSQPRETLGLKDMPPHMPVSVDF